MDARRFLRGADRFPYRGREPRGGVPQSQPSIDEIELGAKYRDRITGCEGTCTGRLQYINGCVQGLIAWGKDGEPHAEWFDVDRLELLAAAAEQPELRRVGGPSDAPKAPAAN